MSHRPGPVHSVNFTAICKRALATDRPSALSSVSLSLRKPHLYWLSSDLLTGLVGEANIFPMQVCTASAQRMHCGPQPVTHKAVSTEASHLSCFSVRAVAYLRDKLLQSPWAHYGKDTNSCSLLQLSPLWTHSGHHLPCPLHHRLTGAARWLSQYSASTSKAVRSSTPHSTGAAAKGRKRRKFHVLSASTVRELLLPI